MVVIIYFATRYIDFESHMPFLLVVMKIPTMYVDILQARGLSLNIRVGKIA